MVDHGTHAKKFGFLLRSWYNAADVDAGAQNPYLRLQQLKVDVVSRPEPLQSKSQEREKQVAHTDSFRSARRAGRRENAWYHTADEFMYPQDKALQGPQGRSELIACRKPQVYRKLYRTN